MDPAQLPSGPDRLAKANHLAGLANGHEHRKEYVEAERYYEEALAIYEEIHGIQHPTTARATQNLARILRIQGKTAEASLMDDHAEDILTSRSSPNEAPKMPFGGSNGFFGLLGNIYTHKPDREA